MKTTRVVALFCGASLAFLSAGCGGPEVGTLEIGIEPGDGGPFIPLEEGDPLPLVLISNGLLLVQPSLRVAGAEPTAPEKSVEVWIGDILVAATLSGESVDLRWDGTGWVLWDLRAPVQAELCCVSCREATLIARLVDSTGREFTRELQVRLQRGDCPDPAVCCPTADLCVDPSLVNLCM